MTKQPWLKIYGELGVKNLDFIDRPMGSFIEQYAKEKPDSPAILYYSRVISYKEYNVEVNKLANALVKLGITKGDVVGLHIPNIPQYMIALGAVSKIGAIGSGVSPLLASPELAYQLNDSRVKALLTLPDMAPVVTAMDDMPKALKTLIFCGPGDYLGAPATPAPKIDGLKTVSYLDIIENEAETFRQCATHWNDTVMIQYTGGTTGRPKGAELGLRAMMSNLHTGGALAAPPVDNEVYASPFPLFHLGGLAIVVITIVWGGAYHLYPDPRDTDHFCRSLSEFPPTRIALVPALYDMLLSNPLVHDIDFSTLRFASTGAAPMTSSTADRLRSLIGPDKLQDGLGMTETGPIYILSPPSRAKQGSVGIPCVGIDVRIMDAETGTRQMPFGEPGEICCSGANLMKGYLGLPEETKNALREMDGKTWMYSGDIGYMDEEGYVFLCDRAKDMLIVGGYKVFSVEIEDKLQSMPQIAMSAIIGTKDERRPGNDIVNLYVELNPSYKDADPEQIKADITAFCRKNMAPYKIPKQIHFTEAIPLTAVGKIDKKALRV